ncbi:MAG: hypothetical protein GY839_11660 [candidate division Zixibacteria bacterium]|nr:hypothetical protein [candidate division Zixibacteria bacterium]
MNLTLDYLKSNRKWLVPNLMVWGNTDSCLADFLMSEIGSPKRVVFSSNVIGGRNQVINYADLIDSNGNILPAQIADPVIIIIPRNQAHCFLIGRPSPTGFKIARGEAESDWVGEGLVDVLIMEVDLP